MFTNQPRQTKTAFHDDVLDRAGFNYSKFTKAQAQEIAAHFGNTRIYQRLDLDEVVRRADLLELSASCFTRAEIESCLGKCGESAINDLEAIFARAKKHLDDAITYARIESKRAKEIAAYQAGRDSK